MIGRIKITFDWGIGPVRVLAVTTREYCAGCGVTTSSRLACRFSLVQEHLTED